MHRLLTAALAATLAFALSACGDDDDAATETEDAVLTEVGEDEEASGDDPQPCPIEPGDIIPTNYHEVGCVDTERNDQLTMGSYFNCKGGARLFSDDVGYGILGEPLEAPSNDGLTAAMDACDP